MISASSPVATQVLSNALVGVTWTELLPYSLLIVWITCFAIAIIHPVSRAFLHCNLVLFRTLCGLNRMYVESNKQAGQWFSRTTCIAIIDDAGEFVRLFYGKPELMYLMQADKEKQNDKL